MQHPIPAYDFWPYYLKNGIEEAGHTWTECPNIDWAMGLMPLGDKELGAWKEEVWGKTVKWLKANPADLFLSYLSPQQIDINAINEIKKLGVPCVNFYCDHLRDFRALPHEFATFDLNWVPEVKATKLYQKAGYPYISLPMPMWIEPHLRSVKEEKFSQATFIGSKEIQRQMFLDAVLKQAPTFPIAVYGNGWIEDHFTTNPASLNYTLKDKINHQFKFLSTHGVAAYLRKIGAPLLPPISDLLASKVGGKLNFQQYNDLTSSSMITLGINRYPSFRFPLNKPDTYSRLRDIEAPMLGACYLTEWTEGIDELYETGREIETYKTVDDLTEKVKELSGNSAKRKALKINGQKKALAAHTIPSSLKNIITWLQL